MNNFAIKYYTNLNFIDILSVLWVIKRENANTNCHKIRVLKSRMGPLCPVLPQP